MFHMRWILHLQDTLKYQNLEIIPIDFVVQCVPHDNIVLYALVQRIYRDETR